MCESYCVNETESMEPICHVENKDLSTSLLLNTNPLSIDGDAARNITSLSEEEGTSVNMNLRPVN